VVLEFELREPMHLLGRHSTTWAISPAQDVYLKKKKI
jgi:hypothetical protein